MKTSISVFIGILLVFFSLSTNAQEESEDKKENPQADTSSVIPEFGSITMEELTSTHHPSDSTAEAAILYKTGETHFNSQLFIVHKKRLRIKIYDKKALKWGDAKIITRASSIDERENVRKLRGMTYNLEDGKIVKHELTKADIHVEKYNENTFIETFTLPRVKVGSVIEYEYEMIIPNPHWLDDWYFQDVIPVNWSEYKFTVPSFLEYRMIGGGFLEFDINESYPKKQNDLFLGSYTSEMVYRWGLKDVPAFKNEKYITTPEDYLARVKFQLSKVIHPFAGTKEFLSTWKELSINFLESPFYLEGKKIGSKVAKSFIAPNSFEKAKKIYEYVQNTFKWNGVHYYYPSQKSKYFWKKKLGNSTDINLLLCNMLNAANIEAQLVLLSTRSHGKLLADYPLIDQFNHTIVIANTQEGKILLDATNPYAPFGLLPPDCLNGRGLIMDVEKPLWVILEQGNYGLSDLIIGLKYIEEEEKFNIQVKEIHKGLAALERRVIHAYDDKQLEKAYDLGKVQDISFENTQANESPFIISYHFDQEAEVIGDHIYLGLPCVPDFLKDNPFKSEVRRFPIDYGYPSHLNYRLTIQVPPGYEVESLPSEMTSSLEGETIKFVFKTMENKGLFIQTMCVFKINQGLIAAEQYPALKNLYEQAIAKFSEQIVLKKKTDKQTLEVH